MGSAIERKNLLLELTPIEKGDKNENDRDESCFPECLLIMLEAEVSLVTYTIYVPKI